MGWGRGEGVEFGTYMQNLFWAIREGFLEEVILEYRLKVFILIFSRRAFQVEQSRYKEQKIKVYLMQF